MKNTSCQSHKDKGCPLSDEIYPHPLTRHIIHTKSGKISKPDQQIINKISPVIQIQTIFHIAIISKYSKHEQHKDSDCHNRTFQTVPRHPECHTASDGPEYKQDPVIIPVCHGKISPHHKTAGVQCLSDRRAHNCDQARDIKKTSKLFCSHNSVKKRCDHNLQNCIHKDQSAHSIQSVYCNIFFLFLFFQSVSRLSVSHRFPCDPYISHSGSLCIYAFLRRAPGFHPRSLL